MAGCVTGKKMYASKEMCEQALIDAWIRYDYKPGQGPIAVYLCDDCKQYHLTSTGKMNDALERHLNDGKIKLQKEANAWLDKFKKR